MPDGWCPFAERINGVTTFDPHHLANVGFCDHTAGGFYSTMRQASFWNGAGVSTHFAISRKGEICQMVSIFNTAFAQGRLGPTVTWRPYEAMGRQNPNLYLISTEHEDAETVNGKTRFIPGSEWTEAQFQADLRVKRWCYEEVRRVTGGDLMRFGIDSLAGHHMFDGVNRAECPGRFWREQYRVRLHGLLGVPPVDVLEGNMANISADGSKRVVEEGPFIVTYNGNVAVQRLGSTDGRFPGRISKKFGQNWLWFRTLDDAGNLVAPYWSEVEGD